MTAETITPQAQAEYVKEQLRLLDVLEDYQSDPKALINEVSYFDPQSQLWVNFRMFPPAGWEPPIKRLPSGDLQFGKDGAADWLWQGQVIDWIHDPNLHAYLIYKARQLGITLIACAYALWLMLARPGVNCAAFSYEEGEAFKLVQAAWSMYERIPDLLKEHVQVISPMPGKIPTEWIKLRHPDGRVSTFQALPATGMHGHGARVTFAIQDELAKQPYGRKIYEAIVPAVLSRGGKWLGISTADGVSNLETGEGNFFHHLYAHKKEYGLRYTFLPWSAEPTRDEVWYGEVAMKLPEIERNRQYPLNENDGFVLSGALYFERDALKFYREEVIPPTFSGQFTMAGTRKANFIKFADGIIDIYEEPRAGRKYGIAVDTATGKGADYTSADVIDFSSGQIVAHLHAKIASPRAATQVHFLGKWYNTAIIMVERGGGYGEALVIALKDGNRQLPSYPKMYFHVTETKRTRPISDDYGFPMTPKNRPIVLEKLSEWIRKREFPWLPAGHVDELQTFVYKDTNPSPRAQDGTNDDRVMSLAMAVQLFDRYGESAQKQGTGRKRKRTTNKYRAGPVKAGG